MRWPWQQRETREKVGGYTEILSRLVEAQSAGTTQLASATAATEAVAGLLSRSLGAAVVEGPGDVAGIVTPRCLAQVGRDLIRVGESLHVLRFLSGRLLLVPASTWYWEGGADPATWLCTATAYGPSGSSTWRVPQSSVVFVSWGSPTARPYHGLSPSSWAADTARLNANTERSLADEASGPVAQLLPVPQDGGDDSDDDPLAMLKTDIKAARGKAVLVETVNAGWAEGKAAAPQSDWKQQRLGPSPTEAMVKLADAAFNRVLAASGCSPALFDASDGTSKREALRQWHLGVVMPLARQIEHELMAKLDSYVRLRFDLYNVDLAGRAQAFQKLVAGGVAVNEALATTGLLADD